MKRKRKAGGVHYKGSQQSVYYPYSDSLAAYFKKEERDLPKIYEHMFVQDVQASVFPLRRSEGDWLTLKVQNPEHEESIAEALHERHEELKDALWHFTDSGLMYSLLTYQRAYYEIVYYDDGTFRFVSIANHTMLRFLNSIFQYVPKRAREYGQLDDEELPRFIRLNPRNVFHIDVPKHLRRTLRKIMKGLDYISDHSSMPDFARKQMMEGNGMYPFDYTSYHRSVVRYVATLTKDIGWSGRRLFKDEELEYYNLLRYMRFEQFKHELRECIIEGLNKGLRKVNKEWETPQLKQTVFPQHEDIQNSVKQLREAPVKFTDWLNPYLKFA